MTNMLLNEAALKGTETNFLDVLRRCGEVDVKYRDEHGRTVLMLMATLHASHYDWLCIVRERLYEVMRQKDFQAQLNGDDWMVDGEKLSTEEIAVAIQWRNLDKDALSKRLFLMLAQAGAAQLRIVIEGDDGDADAQECAEMVRGYKRARTATS